MRSPRAGLRTLHYVQHIQLFQNWEQKPDADIATTVQTVRFCMYNKIADQGRGSATY